jgi:multicomponent Na+:H+ antiporter subunit F
MMEIATDISFVLLGLAALFTLIRIARGPTLADRILGLETLSGIGAGFIASYAAHSGLTLYADIAIALILVSLLPTASLARYLLSRQHQ